MTLNLPENSRRAAALEQLESFSRELGSFWERCNRFYFSEHSNVDPVGDFLKKYTPVNIGCTNALTRRSKWRHFSPRRGDFTDNEKVDHTAVFGETFSGELYGIHISQFGPNEFAIVPRLGLMYDFQVDGPAAMRDLFHVTMPSGQAMDESNRQRYIIHVDQPALVVRNPDSTYRIKRKGKLSLTEKKDN